MKLGSMQQRSWLGSDDSAVMCLRFWLRQFVKKWLTFSQNGDDFNRDSDTSSEESYESEEFEDCEGIEGCRDEVTREIIELEPDSDQAIPVTDALQKRLLRRVQSETIRQQYVFNHDYKIAVGTWNVGGLLPPDDLDLEGWIDTSEPADIYVLGFQEVVPLSTGNVLCVEDEAPVTIWEGLIRNTLNNKIKFHKEPLKSFSAPPSPWHEDDITSDVPEVSSLEGLLDTVVNEEVLNTSLLTPEQNLPNSNKTLSNCQHNSSDTQLLTKSGPDDLEDTSQSLSKKVTTAEDWLAEAATADDDFSEETPLVAHSSQLIDHSCNYCRVASKQMVGVLITIWVRSDLRRHVHNIKVCGIRCGIFNFLGNKGGISVSMSLHQTSFCFVCTHLTSGHMEGDELRRNANVAEILRCTKFPRLVKLSGVELPETIMAHDRIIWLGDLNYRIAESDEETWKAVNQNDWEPLLQRDQLKLERDAGRVFAGWHEGTISFPPTYKFVVDSDRYYGEVPVLGDKRRTPAWCDRILWYGKGVRQMEYLNVESQLSDHRPVTAKFVVDIEVVSGRKLNKAGILTEDANPKGKRFYPDLSPPAKFTVIQNHKQLKKFLRLLQVISRAVAGDSSGNSKYCPSTGVTFLKAPVLNSLLLNIVDMISSWCASLPYQDYYFKEGQNFQEWEFSPWPKN